MKWTQEKIRRVLGDKLIGKERVKNKVCKTILLLPEKYIERVCHNVWFVSSPDDAWGFTFKGNDIKNKHLIFLSDDLFLEDEEQIRYTILHEIGHVVLNHKNSIGFVQTPREIKKQEREADDFVKQLVDRLDK